MDSDGPGRMILLFYCGAMIASTIMAGGTTQRIIHENIEPDRIEIGKDGVTISGFDWSDYTGILIAGGLIILIFTSLALIRWGPALIQVFRKNKNDPTEAGDINVKTNGVFKLDEKIGEIITRLESLENSEHITRDEIVTMRTVISESEARVIHEIDELKGSHLIDFDNISKGNEKINENICKMQETSISLNSRVETILELVTGGKLKRADENHLEG